MKKTFLLVLIILINIFFGLNHAFAKVQVDSYQLVGVTRCDTTGFYFANLNLLFNNTQVASLMQVLYPSGPVPGVCYYGGDLGLSCSVTNIVSDNTEYYFVNYSCYASSYYNYNYRNGYVEGSFFLLKSEYDLCPLGAEFCDGTSPTPSAPIPTNLIQSIEMPDPDNHSHLPREEIGSGTELGYKIGHFQSGSGIILSAYVDNQTGKEIQLQFTLTNGSGQTLPPYTSTGFTTGTGEVTIPDLPAGDYTWQVKTVGTGLTDSVEVSRNSDTSNPDFALFYGFEPYPYGYKFPNSSPQPKLLSGGVGIIPIPFSNSDFRFKIPGTKWDIFNTVFPEEVFPDKEIMYDIFESYGLNEDNPSTFSNGSCLGLSETANIWYKDKTKLLSFLHIIGDAPLWGNVKLSTNPLGEWDEYNDFLKEIFSFQLSQKWVPYINAEKLSYSTQTPLDILDKISKTPDTRYILSFGGAETSTGIIQGHVVVPYKVEKNRIYIWDNTIPFPTAGGEKGLYKSYEQYIEIDQNGGFSLPLYKSELNWNYFTKLALVNVEDIFDFNNNPQVIGFDNSDTLYALSGKSNIYVTDFQGKVTGFKGGKVYEDVLGAEIISDLGVTLSGTSDNTFKQLYLPQKMDGLTLHIDGTTDEKYTLMIAGGDYYQKLEGVSTSSGQTDTFTTTGTGLTINFDDTKTGTYSLLMDNFHDYGTTNTGTVYIDSANVIPQPQQYAIDWSKVLQNTNDATQHTVDTNDDGVIGNSGDTITNLPPVFQDIIPPTTTATLTGTLVPNSTGSYYDTATINLNAIDNTNGSGVEKTYYSINTGSILTYTGSITLTNTGTTTNNYTLNYYSVDKFNNTELTQTISFSITKTPTITKGGIQGVIYEDKNLNGKRDTKETGLKDWKIYALKVDTKNSKKNEEESKDREKGNNKNKDNSYKGDKDEYEYEHEDMYKDENNKKQESLEEILKRFQRDTKEQTKVLQSKLKTTTDVNGNYNFTNVEDGVYIVLEGVEKWWFPVNPILGMQIVEIQNGQQVTNKNFGNKNTKKK